MKCLLDIDGVLADFVQGACNLHNVSSPYLDDSNLGNYRAFSKSIQDFWKDMEKEFWVDLPVMPDAHAIVNLVEQKFGKENVCLLSSPTNNWTCMEGKLRWIGKNFPQFKRRFLFGSCKEFCASPTSILIDDYDQNVESFREAGGTAFLYPRLWNTAYKNRSISIGLLSGFLQGLA